MKLMKLSLIRPLYPSSSASNRPNSLIQASTLIISQHSSQTQYIIVLIFIIFHLLPHPTEESRRSMAVPEPIHNKSEEEWRAILSPEQFRILREKGTELKGTGEYNKLYDEGVYNCAGCKTPLYKSTSKFDSGCGWPAFFEGFPGAITRTPDPDGRRTEITCTACGGHLGHVFKGEGFKTPTDERHCVNSVSVKFIPANCTSL